MDKKEGIRQRLDALVHEIQELYKFLDADAPQLPTEASKQLAKGICLKCKKKISKKDQKKARRGCHDACYRQQNRRIKAGLITDDQLVREGLWAPKQDGGRPRADAPLADRDEKA